MPDNARPFGAILKSLRAERGLYQKDIAEMLGVTVATVSHYEVGVHEPDLAMLCRLADFFGVSADYLLGRTAVRRPDEAFGGELGLPYGRTVTPDVPLAAFAALSPESRRDALEYAQLLKMRDEMRGG